MTSPVFLAVDSGTSRMKAAIVTGEGQLLALESCEIAGIMPFDGASEAGMGETWQAFCRLCGDLAGKYPEAWKRLAGVCVTGQGDGCWPVGRDWRPARNAILWNDTRTRQLDLSQAKDLETYCRENFLTQLFPGAAPLQLVWLKKFEPHVFENIRYVLHCKDWLNFCLTGEIATDYSDASTALLNIHALRYDAGLLDLLGIEETAEFFPPPAPAGSKIGMVTPDASNQSRIPAGIPVIMGGIDVSVAAAGAGVTQPGDALTIIGTTLSNQVVLSREQVDTSDPRGSTLRHVIAGRYLRLLATSSGTSSIDWARKILAPGLSFEDIEAGIGQIRPGCEGVLFQPYLYGERAPFRNPKAAAGFYGLSARHTPMHMLRAVYEGLVYATLDCFGVLPQVVRLVVAGGGAKSGLLCQMLADALGIPVRKPAGDEHGIRGVYEILRQGGWLKDAPAASSPAEFIQYEPDPRRKRLYREAFQVFKSLRESLEPYWDARENLFRNEQ